ncbi:MAG TPA: DUF1345 domain-containing protein [Candidatus Cybelea sp.]|jgi:uncharacterized membrane protein|nr:DUF1345 domain-containing protein [Candidatus Cybelea sp.]
MKSRALLPIAVFIVTVGLAGLAMRLFAPDWLPREVRVVACYDAGLIAMMVWYWRTILQTKADRAKLWAASQDPGRDAVFVLTLMAVVFGFIAALAILGRGPRDSIVEHTAIGDAIGFGAVVLGWLLIHTVYSFRYAHLYYRDSDRDKESDQGLFFPGKEDPDHMDFAYFSFVIGMTFQVSDVQITSKGIRRQVLGHGLISFAYNTAILALVVNVVSGLLH